MNAFLGRCDEKLDHSIDILGEKTSGLLFPLIDLLLLSFAQGFMIIVTLKMNTKYIIVWLVTILMGKVDISSFVLNFGKKQLSSTGYKQII